MGDRARSISGGISFICRTINADKYGNIPASSGAFYEGSAGLGIASPTGNAHSNVDFLSSRVIPTGAANVPRSWGSLACAYFGQRATA